LTTRFDGTSDQSKRWIFVGEWTDLRSGFDAIPISNMGGENNKNVKENNYGT